MTETRKWDTQRLKNWTPNESYSVSVGVNLTACGLATPTDYGCPGSGRRSVAVQDRAGGVWVSKIGPLGGVWVSTQSVGVQDRAATAARRWFVPWAEVAFLE